MTRTHCDWCDVIIPAGKRGEFARQYVLVGQMPLPGHPSDYRLVVTVDQDGHVLELCLACYDKACRHVEVGTFL